MTDRRDSRRRTACGIVAPASGARSPWPRLHRLAPFESLELSGDASWGTFRRCRAGRGADRRPFHGRCRGTGSKLRTEAEEELAPYVVFVRLAHVRFHLTNGRWDGAAPRIPPREPSRHELPSRDHGGPMARSTTRNRGPEVGRPNEGLRRRRHWEGIYRTRGEEDLSWHQDRARLSLRILEEFVPHEGRILDAAGGSSSLASELARRGFSDVTVVDVSDRALARGRRRVRAASPGVRRIRCDLLDRPELGRFEGWHDRAFFHFLVRAQDRRRYVALLRRSVAPGGVAIIATFARDGPTTCSGLPVERYSAARLAREFAPGFRRVRSLREMHRTPWGTRQPFTYVVLRRRSRDPPRSRG